VHRRNNWASVLNPSDSTFESIKSLLKEANAIGIGGSQGGNRFKSSGMKEDFGAAMLSFMPAALRSSAISVSRSESVALSECSAYRRMT
jgi:hypothetical protein